MLSPSPLNHLHACWLPEGRACVSAALLSPQPQWPSSEYTAASPLNQTTLLFPQFISSTDPFQKALREEEKRRKKEEKRKEIRKGPRISRSQSEL